MKNDSTVSDRVAQLIQRGVEMPFPATVEIDHAVELDKIASGAVIHAGSRILGAETSIGPRSVIGAETPATVKNCQLGKNVSLGGGFFSDATFLDGSSMGSGAHVRSGTLLEEEASGAHTVGFKQTIFLPFVIAGSLVNFCDGLMAGGTSRKNHSEIGSSYIHFNFTPRQDKATASLIGDVPRGVMLNQPPIFLGGQGGLVGPAIIAYGSVIPAGVVCRGDVLQENQLYIPKQPASGSLPNAQGQYGSIKRIIVNNFLYIGNLHALKCWYREARVRFMAHDDFAKNCWTGALRRIESGISERIKRLDELAERMPNSLRLGNLPLHIQAQQEWLIRSWPQMRREFEKGPAEEIGASDRAIFLSEWNAIQSESYLDAIAPLSLEAKAAGTAWLQAIVNSYSSLYNPGS